MLSKTTLPAAKSLTCAPSTYRLSNHIPEQVSVVPIAILEPLTVVPAAGFLIAMHEIGVAVGLGVGVGVADPLSTLSDSEAEPNVTLPGFSLWLVTLMVCLP